MDANDSTSFTASSTAANTGIFSRRPSFFGGRKLPKTPAASTTAPTINLQPVSNSSDAPPLVRGQYESPAKVQSTPPRRRHASRHSISSTLGEIGVQLNRSRSASIRTNDSSGNTSNTSSHKRTPSATLALSFSPEKNPTANAAPSRPALSISTFSRNKQKSAENAKPGGARQGYEKEPLSAVDNPKTPFGMAVPLRYPPTQKEMQQARRQESGLGNMNYSGGLGPAAPISVPSGANPNIIFQHIHELASKRISTLDYLRKSHEGRIYWFNTLLFSKPDLTRLPSFTPRNLARRATHYLLLGFSLPTILDLNASSPTDYLKALNALLLEFEQYQSVHPTDGSAPSSLGRGRIPGMQMFKRVNVGGKGRRSSSATDNFPLLSRETSFGEPQSAIDSPPNDDLLLPNESYSYLQTPSLPFDPDFFSTFATLCDVLIDSYTKILSLLSTPESIVVAGGGVPNTVGELFNKADARVRKIILAGVVREFEESCRQGGFGRVDVSGGELMAHRDFYEGGIMTVMVMKDMISMARFQRVVWGGIA